MKQIGKLQLINPHIIVAYIIVIVVFTLLFLIKTPLISGDENTRLDTFQDNSISVVILYYFFITFVYFLTIYFLFNTMSGNVVREYFRFQIKQGVKEVSQEYQLKDLEHDDKVFDYEHRKNMKEVEHLKAMAEINFKNAKTDIEKGRAYLIRYASLYAAGMSDRWRSYVYNSAMGSPGTRDEDKGLEDELNRVKADFEREKVRKEKIDNDDREDKYKANKQI